MSRASRRRNTLLFALSFIASCLATDTTPNTGEQHQGFTFGYTTSNLVLPITYTCPTPLTLTQIYPTNDGGPDPVAPYNALFLVHEQLQDGSGKHYERMYARSMNVGDMGSTSTIDHPWMNGTQFIGCIWSSNGVSGGCQDLVTVVPDPVLTEEQYTNTSSYCRSPAVVESWVPPLSNQLAVDVLGASGTVSSNAWPASCSDLQFVPQNGTGPYTLIIAPAAHPPINITSQDSKMNYTVRLSHGQAFMAGIVDSAGNSWAFGPLHAGASDDLACLAVASGQTLSTASKGISTGAFAGGIVGAFVFGALGAILLAWLLSRRQKQQKALSDSQELLNDPYADPRPAVYRNHSATSSTFPKPDQTATPYITQTPYTDLTPPLDSTPSTLYDPSHRQSYPATPANRGSTSYANPYEPYNPDFGPSWNDRTHGTQMSSEGYRSSNRDSGGVSSQGKRSSGGMHVVGGPATPGSPSEPHVPYEESSRSPRNRRGSESSSVRRVYVVHADGGRDYHIQLPDGQANVIEMPPRYRNDPDAPQPTSPREPGQGISQSSDPLSFIPSHNELTPVRSRGSGVSQMTEEEIRARAEAALAEKSRPRSGSALGPRSPGSG